MALTHVQLRTYRYKWRTYGVHTGTDHSNVHTREKNNEKWEIRDINRSLIRRTAPAARLFALCTWILHMKTAPSAAAVKKCLPSAVRASEVIGWLWRHTFLFGDASVMDRSTEKNRSSKHQNRLNVGRHLVDKKQRGVLVYTAIVRGRHLVLANGTST